MTQVSTDEMYDEMLRGEFAPRGKHAAAGSGPALPVGARVQGVQISAAPDAAAAVAAATPLHPEFEAVAPPAPVEEVHAEGEGPRGLARYRNAAMVGAGGLACAAVGAFLGGLGGYFTIAPAAAHPLASSTTPDQSLAGAANGTTGDAATSSGTEAVLTAVLTSLSGSLTQNAAPLQWLTAHSGSAAPVAATLTDLTSAGSTGTGSDAGGGTALGAGAGDLTSCTTGTTDAGLGCVLGSLTTALGDVGTLPSDPTEELSSLVPSLNGVITDVTGTLANLGSLMPISSLPLPAGGIPALGLPAIPAISGVPGLAGLVQLVALDSLSGVSAIPGLDGLGSVPGGSSAVSTLLSGTGGIAGLLDGVTAAATGLTGSTGTTSPTLPSLPLGGGTGSIPGVPSLPVSASAGGTTSTPAGSASAGATTGSATTTSTTSTSTTTTTTTVTVPLPSLPVPVSTPPVSVGGVSVGINTSGSGSGLTLSLP